MESVRLTDQELGTMVLARQTVREARIIEAAVLAKVVAALRVAARDVMFSAKEEEGRVQAMDIGAHDSLKAFADAIEAQLAQQEGVSKP